MAKRQWVISAILTLIILLIGSLVMQKFKSQKKSSVTASSKQSDIRPVKVKQLMASTIQKKIDVDGRVQGYEKISLSAEVSGRLAKTKRHLKAGSYFKAGELLFSVISDEEVLSMKAQKAALLASITQIMPDLKFDYPEAYQGWKIYLDNYDVNKNLSELPKPNNSQERYYLSAKNIYNQYYNILALEERLSKYNIYAPFNGVFLSVNAYPGSVVSPGSNLGQIMNTYRFELVAPIRMEDFKYVQTGQKVNLSSEGLDKNWIGTVNRISKQIDQSTQSIPVYIGLQGTGLRDGMYLKGSLNANQLDDVLSIPKSALINQNELYVVIDSILNIRQVEIESEDVDNVYIKATQTEDPIVIESVNTLFEGQKVIQQFVK